MRKSRALRMQQQLAISRGSPPVDQQSCSFYSFLSFPIRHPLFCSLLHSPSSSDGSNRQPLSYLFPDIVCSLARYLPGLSPLTSSSPRASFQRPLLLFLRGHPQRKWVSTISQSFPLPHLTLGPPLKTGLLPKLDRRLSITLSISLDSSTLSGRPVVSFLLTMTRFFSPML